MILIIEDDADYRSILEYDLELHGFEVMQADSGEQGLKCAKKKIPELILLDCEMPGLTGLDVLRKFKSDSATRHIPVFMLTGHSMIAEVERAFGLGADDYIPKPNDVVGMGKRVMAKLLAYRERKSATANAAK